MLRKLTLPAAALLALTASGAMAAGGAEITDYAFSFEGPFGSYDQLQLQRGLQLYTDVCAACHGLDLVAFRTLGDAGGPNLPEDQVFAYAERFQIFDPTLFDGEGGNRPGTPADHYPGSSIANAPDLSLMAKARAGFSGPYGLGLNQLFRGMGGAEYIASIMAGYAENPECAPDGITGYYYNTAFAAGGFPESCVDEDGHNMVPGSWIAMAPPLYDGVAEFADGSPNDLHSVSEDVAAFLMWAAEPHMNARKQAGLTGVIFLTVLAVLLYLTNKRLWAPHKNRDH